MIPDLDLANSTATHFPVGQVVRWLAEAKASNCTGGEDETHGFGVHITYDDLYSSIIFLVCIYFAGQVASRLLRMPSLVGEIIAGILLGPPLANYVSFPPAWVMFGEIGYVNHLYRLLSFFSIVNIDV